MDEVRTHPWFIEGGVLMNRAIFQDLHDGKITKAMAAKYLDCSIDYLYWIEKNYPITEDINATEN